MRFLKNVTPTGKSAKGFFEYGSGVIAGRVGQEYNRRKNRKGAFREDR